MYYFSNLFDKVLYMFRRPCSVVGIGTGYGLNGPGIEPRWGARFSAPVQTGPGAHPASWTMDTGFFTGVKSGRGVTLTTHALLVPWSRRSRAIPLLPLWAVRLVQSLSACTRVHFTFLLYSTCFGQVRWPSSGVSQQCIHAIDICHASSVGCLLAWSGWTTLADGQQN